MKQIETKKRRRIPRSRRGSWGIKFSTRGDRRGRSRGMTRALIRRFPPSFAGRSPGAATAAQQTTGWQRRRQDGQRWGARRRGSQSSATGGSRGGPTRPWPPPNAEPTMPTYVLASPKPAGKHIIAHISTKMCRKFNMQESCYVSV